MPFIVFGLGTWDRQMDEHGQTDGRTCNIRNATYYKSHARKFK